jgi:TonB family protein
MGVDPMTEPQLRASLSMLDTFRQTFLSIRATYPTVVASTAADARGQTVTDDLQNYCFSSAEQAAISRQFSDASATLDRHDLDAAGLQLRALYHRLRIASIQCKTVIDYWRDVATHPRDWEPYRAMLQANSVEPHYAVNIASLERTLQLKVRHGLFIDAIGGTLPILDGVRARGERLDIHELETKAATSEFQGLYPRAATQPCGPPASRTSGKPDVSLDTSRPQPKLIFPPESQHMRESGTVYVGVTVGSNGCAQRATVVGSSGYERLDRAGAEYALTVHFRPADQNGIAIEHFAVIPINYQLTTN